MNTFESLYYWLGDDYHNWDIQYRIHATQRMFQRNIDETDIFSCFDNGQIIEYYDSDLPFPSILVNGRVKSGKSLHVVAGVDKIEKRLYIITVYEPDPSKWENDFSRRLKK